MPYSGANAHEDDIHVSVFAGLGDNTVPWNLGGGIEHVAIPDAAEDEPKPTRKR